ncbi:MAG: hypothetical protein WCL06_01290 [Bacteroidota bacterium]
MKKKAALLNTFSFILLILFQLNLYAQMNRVKYNIKGNLLTYYALSRDSATHISVKGPGKLTLTTFARFTRESPDSISYTVVYKIDNTDVRAFTANKVIRAGRDVYIQAVEDKPSTVKTFSIKVKPGVHDYDFLMLYKSPQVDLRYKFVPDSVIEWKDKSSLNDSSQVDIKIDKLSTKSYYRFSAESPQTFKVKGPTSLRVITRLEFNYTMQGLISYRVSVKRNDTIIGTYKLEGFPSQEAQYANNRKLIPGSVQEFFLDVPAGDNSYEFTLLDKKFTSLIRVSKGSRVLNTEDNKK